MGAGDKRDISGSFIKEKIGKGKGDGRGVEPEIALYIIRRARRGVNYFFGRETFFARKISQTTAFCDEKRRTQGREKIFLRNFSKKRWTPRRRVWYNGVLTAPSTLTLEVALLKR